MRGFAAQGGWSLALDTDTEFALERTGVYALGEAEIEADAALFAFESMLDTARFGLDAVWGDGLRTLGVAARGAPTLLPRALAMDELDVWAKHPAFEVEVELAPEELHVQLLGMLLRRWLGEHGDAAAWTHPTPRLTLRGG